MAQKGSNLWDVIGKGAEGVLKAAVANQNAQNTLKSQLLLYKIKNMFEQQNKESEMKTKHGYDLALEEAKIRRPFEMWQEYQRQNIGGGGDIRMTPSGRMETVSPRDQILAKILKGGLPSLTPGELQIYNDTMKRLQNTDPFASLNQPGQTTSQTKEQSSGLIRVKHIGSGQTGTIEAGEFDPNIYEKL